MLEAEQARALADEVRDPHGVLPSGQVARAWILQLVELVLDLADRLAKAEQRLENEQGAVRELAQRQREKEYAVSLYAAHAGLNDDDARRDVLRRTALRAVEESNA